MNWFKRALLSLWGHKGRSILLILVFSVIATLIFSSMIIHSASQQEIGTLKDTIGAKVTLRAKPEKYTNGVTWPCTPKAVADKLINRKLLSRYNYHGTADIILNGVSLIGNTDNDQNGTDTAGPLPNSLLIGDTDTGMSDSFTAGGYKLISGRLINKTDNGKNNVLIEQQLAKKNNLRIGDTIKLTIAWYKLFNKPAKDTKCTVVGIFEAPSVQSDYTGMPMENSSNFVFAPFSLVESLETYLTGSSGIAAVNYYLNDPRDVHPFLTEGKKSIDQEKYEFVTDEDWYTRMSMPLESAAAVSNLMFYIILLSSCLILILIFFLLQKGRRREWGILLAMGEKKKKIVLQALVELLVPIAVSFFVALGVSTVIAQKTGDFILSERTKTASTQVQKQDKSELDKWTNGQRAPREEIVIRMTSMVQPPDHIDISLQPADIAFSIAIEFALLLIALAVSLLMIFHLSPSRVLNKKE